MLGEIILAVLLFTSLFLIVVVVVYFRYFRSYTRERFAFKVLLLLSSLVASLIALIFSGGKAVVQLLDFLARLVGLQGVHYEPGFSDKALAVVLIFGLMHLAIKLHRNWPGSVSIREHEAGLIGVKPGIIGGAIAAVADLRGKEPLHAYSASQSDLPPLDAILSPSDTKAWHHWVARILQISSSQYHIDEYKDWYSDRCLFISAYGLKKLPIGILCCEQWPSDEEIQSQIRFVSDQVGAISKLIIASDKEVLSRGKINVDSVDVIFLYRQEMLAHLVDFSRYEADIKFRFEQAEIAEGFPYRLPDVYVESAGYLRKDEQRVEVSSVEEHVVSWSLERSLRHLAILGEYGQGKSVLALKLTHRLIQTKERIPILITLGGRSPRTQSKLEVLADWSAAYDINPRSLLILHELGRLILIFDGFDEMDLVGDAVLRLDHFRTLWEFSRDKQSKILITGRPNFFLDNFEREVSLNVRPESMEVPFTIPIYLRPFSLPKISQALRSFDNDVRAQIVNTLRQRVAAASFRDLVSRPSTLFLAANIWSELRALKDIRSAEVIGRFISHSYERQQRKGFKSFLTGLEREYFTIGVALAAYNNSLFSNHISKEAFQRAIAKLIDGFPSDLRKFESASDAVKPPLRDRLQDRDRLIETVSTDVRSCGIIVTDLSNVDTFKFAHKSFFEFLLALNAVYTLFRWPISKDKILHHAVREKIGDERQMLSPQSILLFPGNPRLFSFRMSREVAQFSGEILYRMLGGNSEMSVHELEAKLVSLGMPMKRLHASCALWRTEFISRNHGTALKRFFRGPFVLSSMPRGFPNLLVMMTAIFRAHGKGGQDFIRLTEEIEAGVVNRLGPTSSSRPRARRS